MKRGITLVAGALIALIATTGIAMADSPALPYDTNAKCLACHEVAGGASTLKTQFASSVDLAACNSCHWVDGFAEQPGFSHTHVLENPGARCDDCHYGVDDADPSRLGQWYSPSGGKFAAPASVTLPASEIHAIHGTPKLMFKSPSIFSGWYCDSCHAPAQCSACHAPAQKHTDHALPKAGSNPAYAPTTLSGSVGISPYANIRGSRAVVTASVTCTAAGCHPVTAVRTGASAVVPACTSCHPANTGLHGYDKVDHVATDESTAGIACSACHSLDLSAEHAKPSSSSSGRGCVTCHPTPRDSITAWDQGCVTGACHTAGSSQPFHAATEAAHALPTSAGQCSACHAGSDLLGVHATASTGTGATSCLVCHGGSSAPVSSDCTVCHFTFAEHYDAIKHQSSWTLSSCGGAGCHGTRDLMSVHNEHRTSQEGEFACSTCHDSSSGAVTAAIAAGLTGCADCHEGVGQDEAHVGQHWATPLLLDGAGPHYGFGTGTASGTPTDQCVECHSSNLMAEHLGQTADNGAVVRKPRLDSAGAKLTCATCHAALPGTLVATSISQGLTRCDACHVVHEQIPAVHTSTYVAAPQVPCAPCHSSQIEFLHDAGYTTTTPSGEVLTGCAVCHANYESPRGPVVQAAIGVSNDTRCSACHASAHPDKGGHVASGAVSISCGRCHSESVGAVDVRAIHSESNLGPCAVCHANPVRVTNISTTTAECASCHPAGGYHAALPAAHTYGQMGASCQSSSCHVNTLPEAHAAFVAGQILYPDTCALCHSNQDPNRIPANATAACGDCHASIHPNMDHTAHASQVCVDCHETGDVTQLHQGADGKADCDLCHANSARVPALPATVDCVNCHPGKTPVSTGHYPATAHVASETGCGTCHYLDLNAEHGRTTSGPVGCVSCHEGRVDAFTAAWNKSCAACHASRHTGQAAAHVSTRTSCGPAGCHAIGDVSDLHKGLQGGGCSVCHRSVDAPATTTDCSASGCHPGVTGDHGAQHDASASIGTGCSGCHFTSLTAEHQALGYTCSTCHASTNAAVKAAIAANSLACDACHPAVNGRDRHSAQETLEFIPGNSSGHRVYDSLPGMRSSFKVGSTTYTWTLPSTTSFLKSGWTTSSVVKCADCHSFAASASGPHGSSVSVNMDPSYPGDYSNAYLSGSGVSPSNVICAKCHTNFSNMNGVHGESDHEGSSDGKCVLCHTKIPHGWRLPRLLAYRDDPATYASTGLTGLRLANRSASNWSESDCSVSCGEHSSSMSGRWPSTAITAGNVRGTVRDAAGLPVSGASVVTGGGMSATTDASGVYQFVGLTPGPYTVTVSKIGFATQSKSVTVVDRQTVTADFALVAVQPASLIGTVRAEGGATLADVAVQVSGDGSTSTNSSGAYSLSLMPGTYSVTYSLTGYTSQTKSVTVESGQILTLDVTLAPAAQNLALGRTVTASSSYSSSYAGAKAVDGSSSTYWRSAGSRTESIIVDLGSAQSMSRFVLDWNGTAYARAYRIETSNDRVNWTSRYSFSSTISNPGGDRTVTLSTPASARYVRLYCTSANSSSYQLSEFEVWAR